MDKRQIGAWITAHEGTRNTVYIDTENHPTIGIGFNLDRPDAKDLVKELGLNYDQVRNGELELTADQINHLFQHDLDNAIADAQKLFPNFEQIPADKQMALVDMSFNLGYDKLSDFSKMIDAVNKNDWENAAKEMVDSKWYDQVGDRSLHDVEIMRDGLDKNLDRYEYIFDQGALNLQNNQVELLDQAESQYTDQSIIVQPEIIEVADNNAFQGNLVVADLGEHLVAPEEIFLDNLEVVSPLTTQQDPKTDTVFDQTDSIVEYGFGVESDKHFTENTQENYIETVPNDINNDTSLSEPAFETAEVAESFESSQNDSTHHQDSWEILVETTDSISHEHYVEDSGD